MATMGHFIYRFVYHLLLLLALSLSPAARANPPEGYPFVGYDAGLAQARKDGKPIMLYFGRYGCAWCDHVNRDTFSDPGLKKLFSENYTLIYVDAEGGKRIHLPSGERVTEAELGARLGAFATPLFVFMTPEGRVLAKIPGFKTVADFHDFDHFVRDKLYETQTLAEFLGSKK